jgi:deoxycytidylate deaminase
MTEIPVIKRLEPYFKIAEESAKNSPCVRRQYASVIANTGTQLNYVVRNNSRVSGCCEAVCARTRAQVRNGERVEVGAEIHAETAALIDWGALEGESAYILLVGFSGVQELLGTAVYPCHTCAINIKYAGFNWIYLRDYRRQIVSVSVSEIMEYREAEWDYDG